MLLATDLDGTFLAGESARRHQLYQLISLHPDIDLVFVTGRGLESVLPLLSDPTIPSPDYIICDVGATIVEGETLQPLQPLQAEIERHWPGEHQVQAVMRDFQGVVRQDVPQERRCSYFCEPEAVADQFHQIADELNCDLLYSAGRYLDFLPRGVNKGSTLRMLIEHLELEEESVLVAGDTLNDLAMYEQGFLGVCVGKSEGGLLDSTGDMGNVFHANEPGCGGILEAFTYFNFLSHKGIAHETQSNHPPGQSDLVIVYHRLPFEEYLDNGVVKERPPGSPNGILPTLLSFFADGKKGSWIAWSVFDESHDQFKRRSKVDADLYPNLTAAKISLSKDEVDIFYRKFSKEAFWPTLHTFWQEATFREDHWQVFLQVNRRFAEQAAAEAAENAVVWIHDYNLWMVPAFLRDMRPDLTIAFFHHTYFPSADVFNVLPWRRDIIGSLLQCDLIGFHIPRQSENFIDVAQGVAPVKVLEKSTCAPRFLTYGCAVGLDEMTSQIEVHGRKIQLSAMPVGLDLSRIQRALTLPETEVRAQQLRQELSDNRVILSVERLDYTKGILPKLEAFELLLSRHPELIGEVTLVTICVPAAKEMSVYDELQTNIERTVGRINGRFARVGWTPVQFFFRAFPFEELVAYYAVADLMWITPLRDGLNLVAKEFVATQGLTGGNGVLVLSEFAGAAAELRGALLTNPHDPHDLVNTCFQALSMDYDEAKGRLREAFDVVRRYDIDSWGQEFLQMVEAFGNKPVEIEHTTH
ncbi:glucosylglycerol-phosphate synthase [Pseudomaricurvus sp. HS19]|uniref:glucosylglycerol-phosphate synthase n=1 Tax=Pseudomaricurvus sp. HS19 TaxID=2692626 RepID=UPI0013716326|nr:glucosylglycerol-phosphate synthase [Pseudomaricurvus sp. HS19]MYM65062.1 glucosylglycerol-phosphate synthase [Pseudomaricurvus sp. HS19]